jgi:hypothetical protein
MWHWNTLWAPAPGDPPAVDDPKLYRAPWTTVQAFVLQARAWDTLVSSSRAWWSFWMASLAVPAQPLAGQVVPPPEPVEAPPSGHAVPAPRAARPRRPAAPAAKRTPHAESRSGLQARKR